MKRYLQHWSTEGLKGQLYGGAEPGELPRANQISLPHPVSLTVVRSNDLVFVVRNEISFDRGLNYN